MNYEIASASSGAKPLPLMAFQAGSFAAFTVAERLPKIVADVVADLPRSAAEDPAWQALLQSVSRGGEIASEQMAPVSGFWAEEIKSKRGRHWKDLTFFELEFFFYHSMNSVAGRLMPGYDLFARQKAINLRQAVESVPLDVERLPSLESVINLSLEGNTADLSQLDSTKGSISGMVVDERAELVMLLSKPRSSSIHLVADNAGAELVCDLVLIARLLQIGWRVYLHLKPWPMFVSDATDQDFIKTLRALSDAKAPLLRSVGNILVRGRRDGALEVGAAEDWGEPRHLDELSPALLQALCSGTISLLKGDLNYRRAFGDLAWRPDTPVSRALLVPSLQAFALRILKSDIVVGVAKDRYAQLNLTDREWRNNGRFALVQNVGMQGSFSAEGPGAN